MGTLRVTQAFVLIGVVAALSGCSGCVAETAIGRASCERASATDGDTIRCGEERVRMLGIDAPELPGHCRRGRRCAPGDPLASKAALATLLNKGSVTLERVGSDRYDRALAIVRIGAVDASCAQLAAGQAVYVSRWDNGGRVRDNCPANVR